MRRFQRTAWWSMVVLASAAMGQAERPATNNGFRAIDYSYAGYRAGLAALPVVPVRVTVDPVPGDNKRLETSLVRFVPGREGLTLTDPLPSLMDALLQQNVRLQEHH